MAFSMDELLSYLGNPGRYQLLVCLLLCMNYFQVAFNHLAMSFFGAKPLGYRCGEELAIPYPMANGTSMIPNWGNSTEMNSTGNGTYYVDACPIIQKSDDWCVPTVRENCGSCNFDNHYVAEEREGTIVMEFNLVCDDAYLSNLVTTIYFLGVLFGGVVFGQFADTFGRFPILIITMYGPVAVGIGLFFVPNYVGFAILRFIMGFLMQGLQIVNVSLIMEYFSPKHRGVAACVLEVFWGIGVFILALIAFLVRDWRWMQLTSSLLIVITVFYVWLIPESLRWLLSKRKYEKAKKLTNRIARYNGIKEIPVEVDAMLKEHEKSHTEAVSYNITHIFRNRYTLLKSIVLWYLWFAVSLGYYGLILGTGTLYGFKYTNFLIGAAVEIGAYLLAIIILYFFGRRIPLMVYFLFGGVACIVSGTVPDRTATTVLALVGRFGMAGAFSVMFLYTSELYPTLIRSVGLGSCTFWTRVGGLLAPQINLIASLPNTYKPIPIILFGVLSIVAAFLALLLPETLNRKLPDTIEESEEMGWGLACGRNKKYSLGEDREMSNVDT